MPNQIVCISFLFNSSPKETGIRDPWLEQGARPKHTMSTESLETEEVHHELLPDSIIKSDSEQENSIQSPDNGRMSRVDSSLLNRSTGQKQRAPSPSRSVHFEDPNSPRNYKTSTSRAPSRAAERSPTEHRHRAKLNYSPKTNRRSPSSDVKGSPHHHREDVQGTNRNNSGYVNPVTDMELQNGSVSRNGSDGRQIQRYVV